MRCPWAERKRCGRTGAGCHSHYGEVDFETPREMRPQLRAGMCLVQVCRLLKFGPGRWRIGG